MVCVRGSSSALTTKIDEGRWGFPNARARGTISRKRAKELVPEDEDEDVCIWMFVERIGYWLAEDLYWQRLRARREGKPSVCRKVESLLKRTPRFGSYKVGPDCSWKSGQSPIF